jgi:hypothetical protein
MVPRVSIVPLDHHRSALANHVSLRWQNLFKRVPIIRVKHRPFQVFHFAVQSPERCSITTAESPSDSSPAATVKRLDDPKFVVFFL